VFARTSATQAMIAARNTAIARVKKIRRVMDALVTASASTACARASMDGVVLIAMLVAPVTDSAAVATASVLRVNATATLAGLDTVATSALACTIAPNMGTAITERASARKGTVDVIALSHLSLSLANARFIAFVAVSSSALRSTRRKVPARRTSATPSARRSVFLNALLVRCQSTSAEVPVCQLTQSMCSDRFKAKRWLN